MEDGLDIDHRPCDARYPQVCMEETTKQRVGDEVAPLPPRPAVPEPFDIHSVRNGVGNVFMLFEPLTGWRNEQVTRHHARADWAHLIRDLVDVHYPQV